MYENPSNVIPMVIESGARGEGLRYIFITLERAHHHTGYSDKRPGVQCYCCPASF